jgi:hypothetical protein
MVLMMMHKNYKELAAAVLNQAIQDYKRGGSATRHEISMFLNSKNMSKGRPTFPLFCEILDVEPESLSQRLKEKMRQSCDLHR